MERKYLWEKEFRKIKVMYKEKNIRNPDDPVGEIFEIDTHIAEATYLFNLKGIHYWKQLRRASASVYSERG